ncbi:hypothetical protein CRE_12306 [Caenorhabditis remanei]|uniref:Reverse transcriptase domain-containing protein n=1 Tax=Caenorhabditis remanei TaxID=31234 RepID=E3NEP3_CAERE|nr:hypothetical protein CRE_12306 [Caenorhabditis remanei]
MVSKKKLDMKVTISRKLALIDAISLYHLTLSKPKAFMDVILIDFRKAFDSVPHDLLLFKLMPFGLDSSLCDWFRSFLSNRESRIKIDDYISDNSLNNVSGVLQGTVTGPFLFLVYINDLIQSLPSDVYSIAFADDLKIYSENPASLQETLNVISDWCDQWKLQLAENKTVVLHLGVSNPHNDYFIENAKLASANATRDRGLLVDCDLKFEAHIAKIVNNAKYNYNTRDIRTYIFSICLGVPAVILSAAINGVMNFYIFRFIVGFAVAGTLTVGWTYASEMITPSRRFRLRTFPNWANARMMQVGVSWLAGEWRLASYLCATLSATVLPMIWYLPESPVFLEQKKKFERAERSREKIAEICQLEYEPKPREEMADLKKITPMMLLRSPVLRSNFLVLCWMWFYVGMSVYITDLNSGDMAKNFYVGQFLCGFVLTISKIFYLNNGVETTIGIIEPKIPWLGRRFIFIASQLIALCAYVTILTALWSKNKESWWYTVSYIFAYAAQSLCLETCYLSLAELMPTDVRSIAGALMNILMKIGTILASTTKPIKFWYEPMLFMINTVLCTAGLLVVWKYLPESKNMNMQLVGQDEISESNDEESSTNKTSTEVPSDDSNSQMTSVQDSSEKSEATTEKSEK